MSVESVSAALTHALRAQLALLQAEWHVRRRAAGDLVSLIENEAARGALRSAPASSVQQQGAAAGMAGEQGGGSPQAFRYAVAIDRAARYGVFRPGCLTRSIALERLLVRQGFTPSVRIGVRSENGAFEAHAWVELNGTVVGDRRANVARFSPLAGFVSR